MVGEKLGSFTLESILGSGAMGVVYKAVHESTGRSAAVKVISSEVAQKGKGAERFQREATILQQFRHPNIVRWLAHGRYKGTSYFAMEFVPGQTLEQLLQERGPLDWKEVAGLAAQVCDALHYAHEHGVVHRDLKPSNLMITDSGQVKLTDFGIAKDLDATALTATGRTLGTAAYMAPEQIRGTPAVSHKTDLYALGIVMYQMLSGRLPYEGTSAVVLMHAHMNAPPPRPSGKVAEIPRALDDLVIQLMAKGPADRPWDASAVGDALNTLLKKAEQGETVPMVWPGRDESADASVSTRSMEDAPRPRKKSGKSKSSSHSNANANADEDRSERLRKRLEVGAMVLALVAMAAFFGYMFWPPSAPYLYRQAERLMAAEDRHKWKEARDEYLDPLDQRFPDNPYKEQTRAWRDRILLDEVQGRADNLESPVLTKISKPQNKQEERYVVFFTRAAAAEKLKDDRGAVEVWEELDKQLHREDPQERPWHLLARKKADDLLASIAQRKGLVVKLLEEVKATADAGQIAKANVLRNEVIARYGQYSDVAEMLGLTPGGAAPAAAPGTTTPPPAPPTGPQGN